MTGLADGRGGRGRCRLSSWAALEETGGGVARNWGPALLGSVFALFPYSRRPCPRLPLCSALVRRVSWPPLFGLCRL